ncbi:MAG: hypothetical protein Kow00124_12280 [Anaerolineae bacterium]
MLSAAALSLAALLVAACVQPPPIEEGVTPPTAQPPPTAAVPANTPSSAAAPAAAPEPDDETPGVVLVHVVQASETLNAIAALYGVDPQAVLTANNLTGNALIQAGQRLNIPLTPAHQVGEHRVQFGQTLSVIAGLYGLPVELIEAANNITDPDAIVAGQTLIIVSRPGDPPLVQPTAEPGSALSAEMLAVIEAAPQAGWARSTIGGDLAGGYPLTLEADRFILHYQPGTYAEQRLEQLTTLVDETLERTEAALGASLDRRFDLYVAGTLFEPPHASLRGFTRPETSQVFLIYDGTGTQDENRYFLARELAKLIAWTAWGPPASTLLLNGVAADFGAAVVEGAAALPPEQVCAAMAATDSLPSLTALEHDWQSFNGPILSRLEDAASGCFVRHLESTCPRQSMPELFSTSDYLTLCGQSLAELEASWRDDLAAQRGTVDKAELLVRYSREVAAAHQFIYEHYSGSRLHEAYIAADQARTALWQGSYSEARRWLDAVYTLIGFQPESDR